MTDTNHHRGQKHRWCGWDFWGRRAGMGGSSKTTYNKFLTRRRERAQDREKLIVEIKSIGGGSGD